MLKLKLIILLVYITHLCSAQDWSDPINISNLEGMDNQPDIAIDDNGNFHCVWAHKIANNYWKIYYSKSTDEGITWSPPLDISMNSEKWVAGPHIVCDSENHLHVTYDYDVGNSIGSTIHYKEFNGINWSEPINVSEGMPESHANKLVIDNNDRVYCFWFRSINNGTTFFRYKQNGFWSEYFIPYNNNDYYAFMDCSVDSSNNLHWIGAHHYESQSAYDNKAVYMFYDYEEGMWSDFVSFGGNHTGSSFDIDLDSSFLPHLVWQEFTNDSAPPNDATLYVYYNNYSWNTPEIIVEDPMDQQIAIDENDMANIFDIEKTEEGSMFVHHYNKSGVWEGYIIDESSWSSMSPVVENYNNKLFAVYVKPYLINANGDIFFSKSDIITSVNNSLKITLQMNLYPNPFHQNLHISFETGKTDMISIKIFTLQGKLVNTLQNEIMFPGKHEILWNGKDNDEKKVSTGLYLVRLQVGRHVVTRSIIFAQ